MEDDNKQKKQGAIDERLLMEMMAGSTAAAAVQQQEQTIASEGSKKEKAKPKKTTEDLYEEFFFRSPETNARQGKSVYIRPEFHERLTRIVQVIGEDKITIYAYLDNVLEHHFREFGPQIIASFDNKYKPIL